MVKAAHQTTILVADDDATIRTNLRLLLESEGYRVTEAANGLEASREFRNSSVALVLLDLRMPELDGMELLRRHQEQLEERPVIVITALGGSAAAIEAMKLGAYDYITKPFDLDEVLFTVRRALTQKALIAQVQALATVQPGETNDSSDEEFVGRTAAMLQVFKTDSCSTASALHTRAVKTQPTSIIQSRRNCGFESRDPWDFRKPCRIFGHRSIIMPASAN